MLHTKALYRPTTLHPYFHCFFLNHDDNGVKIVPGFSAVKQIYIHKFRVERIGVDAVELASLLNRKASLTGDLGHIERRKRLNCLSITPS